ncbi:MAG: hypothetical protein HN742_36030 [Lentisphaerae bacterium]|nr:hypothetical protein [Lentisphaerota bacterium]MBT7059822.1 hypothetical protein [Lentisphaerota bacterium]MBT7847335.1 hypothetical protein [Lentisphaerota bacterium]
MKKQVILIGAWVIAALIVGPVIMAAQTNLLTNGSFEFWTQYHPDHLPGLSKVLPTLDEQEPLVPVRWWAQGPPTTTLKRSAEAHSGRHAVSVVRAKGAPGTYMHLSYLEVNPGSTYTFGVWIKGKGSITVRPSGKALEGNQELGSVSGKATDQWQEVSGTFTAPRHIRLVQLNLAIGGETDLLIDDAHISAELDHPYDADAVLRDRPVRDADTVLLADFETKDPQASFDVKAHLTDENGGRFGRGLRLDKPDSVRFPLTLGTMPEEGTLECWLSPDSWGKGMRGFIALSSAKYGVADLNSDTSNSLRWGWRIDEARYGKRHSIALGSRLTLTRFRPGQWMHVAVTWDAAAVRFYVDGVLVNLHTDPPVTLWSTPTSLTIGGAHRHMRWNGGVDELHLSKVKRYGPLLPKGSEPVRLAVAAPPPPAVAKATKSVAKTAPSAPEVDIAHERRKLLGTIEPSRPGAFEGQPNPQGHYVYEAASARPLVTGAKLQVRKDHIVPGVDAVRTGGLRRFRLPMNDGLYWTLGDIQPGPYFIELEYQSNKTVRQQVLEAPSPLSYMLYLNGRIIQCNSISDPVQVRPGVWVARLQAAAAEPLRAGDEVMFTNFRPADLVRLVLSPQEPARGAFRAPMKFGTSYHYGHPNLRLNVEPRFVDTKGTPFPNGITAPAESLQALMHRDGKPVAECRIANPLPVALEVQYEAVIRDHYQRVAGTDRARLTLAPHEAVVREIPFEAFADAPAYSMTATANAVNAEEARTALGWPEGETVAFFPGYRQTITWLDPFRAKLHCRVDFSQPVDDIRQIYRLNGRWEMALTPSLQPPMPIPADLAFKPRVVPIPWHQIRLNETTPRMHGAYVRRTFTAPRELVGRSCRLVVEKVTDEGTAYLNGVRIGNVRGGATPLIGDATKVLREGTNELVIVLRDLISIMNPQYVNLQNPEPSVMCLDAPGLFGKRALAMGSVQLEFSPPVVAEDVFVVTSVRKQTIEARLRVTNRSDKAVRLAVKASVHDGEETVLELGVKGLSLAADGSQNVELQVPWKTPRLWRPLDPHLYVLNIELTNLATGERLDLARERFGFRESWIEGNQMMLNGTPIKLKGSTGFVAYWVDSDLQLNRGTNNDANYLDETGMLASQAVTMVCNSASTHNVDREIFWETAKTNMIAAVKRKQNHPCILAWDLSNEWYCFLGYSNGENIVGARRLMGLTDVLRAYDPTRWTFYDGDGDLDGLLDNFCGHYMVEGTRPNPVHGFGFNGHANYFPDGAFWRPLEADFKVGEEVCVNVYRKWYVPYGSKPIMDTENLWKTGGYMPPGFTKVIGEEDVISPAVDSGRGEIVWFWKQNIDAHRDLGCNSISTYLHAGTHSRGNVSRCFIMPDTRHHGFARRPYRQRYSLHNDTFEPARYVLSWTLTGLDGKVHAKEAAPPCEMTTGDLQRGEFSIDLPDVDERTPFTLTVRLEANGRLAYSEERDIEVWPDTPVKMVSGPRTIALFDPSGQTAAVLQQGGLEFEDVGALAAAAGKSASSVLVIGEGALDEKNADLSPLQPFVEKGGRVLVLAQRVTPLGLPADTKLEPREWSSMPFVRLGDHPILEGISSWDLHFWQPDRVSARGAYTKPEGGPAVSLVDSGTITGLEWVQMMELFRARGSYLLCQLNLVGGYAEEPMARELLARVMRYAARGAAVVSPGAQLQVFAPVEGAVEQQLQEVGATYEIALPDAAVTPGAVVLLDAETKPSVRQVTRLAQALRDGTRVVVTGVQPTDAPWLGQLAGADVTVTVPPYLMWTGRGFRKAYHPYTAGLSHADLYYKKKDNAESGSAQAENPTLTIEPFQHVSVSVPGCQELVFPGALVTGPVGNGQLVLDQRRWMTSNEKLQTPARRNLSALMLGLGVQLAPVSKPRTLPGKVDYQPIDLAPFANRALADEKAEDGVGGWSDQGPTADLRTFKTGRRSFQGVPFTIAEAPSSIIVLAGGGRPGTLPGEVTIPVGFQAEGFYFLHSSAYSSAKLICLYQIQYADGSTHDIQVRNEENIRDWAGKPGPFLREKKDTRTRVGWTGSTPMWPLVGVYRMLWVNPRPDVPIKAIRFANPVRRSVPMLLGLTAATTRDVKIEIPKDTAAAARLLAEAKQRPAEQRPQAIGMLRKAIAMAPGLSDAYQTLATLLEASGDEDAALDVYRQWTAAGTATPLPWNRIGKIMLKRQNHKAALEAYTQSLRVEFNQPPIIEARKKLEARQE